MTATMDRCSRRFVLSTSVKAGKYAVVCFISDREGGPPHAAKGMLKELTVK